MKNNYIEINLNLKETDTEYVLVEHDFASHRKKRT